MEFKKISTKKYGRVLTFKTLRTRKKPDRRRSKNFYIKTRSKGRKPRFLTWTSICLASTDPDVRHLPHRRPSRSRLSFDWISSTDSFRRNDRRDRTICKDDPSAAILFDAKRRRRNNAKKEILLFLK